jgi:hypothetical protein
VVRALTAALLAASLCGLCAATASAKPLQHRHELSALFYLDKGWRPVSDYDLGPYDVTLHRILGACKIGAEQLTNTTIHLADKAGYQGGRRVTNLMMLKAIARRITWTRPTSCVHTFNIAEGYMENGGP